MRRRLDNQQPPQRTGVRFAIPAPLPVPVNNDYVPFTFDAPWQADHRFPTLRLICLPAVSAQAGTDFRARSPAPPYLMGRKTAVVPLVPLDNSQARPPTGRSLSVSLPVSGGGAVGTGAGRPVRFVSSHLRT